MQTCLAAKVRLALRTTTSPGSAGNPGKKSRRVVEWSSSEHRENAVKKNFVLSPRRKPEGEVEKKALHLHGLFRIAPQSVSIQSF